MQTKRQLREQVLRLQANLLLADQRIDDAAVTRIAELQLQIERLEAESGDWKTKYRRAIVERNQAMDLLSVLREAINYAFEGTLEDVSIVVARRHLKQT